MKKSLVILLSLLALPIAHAEDLQTVQEMLLRGEPAYFPQNDLRPEEIHYSEWNPGGKRTVILVHGSGNTSTVWSKLVPYFAQDYRVIAIDQRGHNRTPARGFSFSSMTMAHDVLTLMDHLGIQKASLVGFSMGARTAIRFGQLYPERTDAIIADDMHVMGRKTLLKPSPDYPYGPQGKQEDLTQALAGVRAPILFVKASNRPVLWGVGVDHIVRTKPDARIVEFMNTSHGVFFSATPEFAALARHFIETGNTTLPQPQQNQFGWRMKEIRSGAEGTACVKSLMGT